MGTNRRNTIDGTPPETGEPKGALNTFGIVKIQYPQQLSIAHSQVSFFMLNTCFE